MRHVGYAFLLTPTDVVEGGPFWFNMRQICAIKITYRELTENIIKDRCRVFNAVIPLHHSRGFKFSKCERVDEFL